MRLLHLAFLLPVIALGGSPALAATVAPAAAPAPAVPMPMPPPTTTSSVTISLGTTGDFERKTVKYGCEGQPAQLAVDYVNAAPNYLALVPVEEGTLVFTTVLAASGAKYASGKYVWWTKGTEASLYDLTAGDNAKPILTCAEVNETP